jgi:hypothetical protein
VFFCNLIGRSFSHHTQYLMKSTFETIWLFFTGPSDLWNYSFYTPVYNFTCHRLRTTALFRRLTISSFPHSPWLYIVTRVTWWVPHVEQELITFPEHPSSLLVFSGVLQFSMYCFVHHWSVLWFTASRDYSFGTFKLFYVSCNDICL